MNAIRKLIVTAKHWQLFLLLCGAGVAGTGMLLVQSSSSSRWKLAFWLVGVVMWAGAILWAWSWGSFLHSMAPNTRWLSLRLFGVAVVYPVIWIILENTLPPTEMRISVPTGFLFLFCIYYALYFLSRTLVVAETGKAPTLFNYLLLGFLFYFVPIGIWFIQPRINRLFVANLSRTRETIEL